MTQNNAIPLHSQEVEEFKGAKDFENTLKNNATAIKAISIFSCVEDSILNTCSTQKEKTLKCIELFQRKLFGDLDPESPITTELKTNVRWELIDFVVKYRKKDDKRISPETCMNYMRAIKRVMKLWGFDIDIFNDPIFTDRKEGLKPVLDNIFAQQQLQGSSPTRKNTLSKSDLKKLLQSPVCAGDTGQSCFNRLLLICGITLGVRTTEMAHLTLDQFQTGIKLNDEKVILYTAKIGSLAGSSKGKKGGIKEVGRRPTEIVIWNTPLLDGTLNVYEEVSKYIEFRNEIQFATNRFFVRYKANSTVYNKFFEDARP